MFVGCEPVPLWRSPPGPSQGVGLPAESKQGTPVRADLATDMSSLFSGEQLPDPAIAAIERTTIQAPGRSPTTTISRLISAPFPVTPLLCSQSPGATVILARRCA